MKGLKNMNSDVYNAMNIWISQADAVSTGLKTWEMLENAQSNIKFRGVNVTDTQYIQDGHLLIRYKVKSRINSYGNGGMAKGTIIDTPFILK